MSIVVFLLLICNSREFLALSVHLISFHSYSPSALYKRSGAQTPSKKRQLRFESKVGGYEALFLCSSPSAWQSRVNFLQEQKLPLRRWMRQAGVVSETLDEIGDRGL
jgi:hypothetical protein